MRGVRNEDLGGGAKHPACYTLRADARTREQQQPKNYGGTEASGKISFGG